MSRLNGLGPLNQGSMTGRGFGPCGGRLRGCSNWGFRSFFSPKNELRALEEEEKILEEELSIIREEKNILFKNKKE